LPLFAVERHLRGGYGGEDDVVDLQRAFADELDRVLDTVTDPVDDVEICLQCFCEKADGRGGLL
jgi:hypothetical protein